MPTFHLAIARQPSPRLLFRPFIGERRRVKPAVFMKFPNPHWRRLLVLWRLPLWASLVSRSFAPDWPLAAAYSTSRRKLPSAMKSAAAHSFLLFVRESRWHQLRQWIQFLANAGLPAQPLAHLPQRQQPVNWALISSFCSPYLLPSTQGLNPIFGPYG